MGVIGGTYSGNPVAAAADLKVIEIMVRDDYPAKAQGQGEYFKKQLDNLKDKHAIIGDVRVCGIMLAIELVKDRTTKVLPKTRPTL